MSKSGPKAELKLTNSLSGKKEKFSPIKKDEVRMYSCGPTVYDYIHIGNLRAFLLSDIVRRTFEWNGYAVTQVMNITDIGHLASDADDGEDKMTKGVRREGKPITLEAMKELADFYAEKFKENLVALNILQPHHMPKASEHVVEDIELVKKLEKKGFTYKISDGIYFDTSKDKKYGELAGVGKIQETTEESRIGANSEKKNSRDFALWKFNPLFGFESPWGKGFPGWHIECSAMSEKYLGDHFDIHTGGIDLAPIHHNNEIAQSECASGHTFVNYWLHNAFVNIKDQKMAKSLGNFFKLSDLAALLPDKNPKYSAVLYRYYLLLTHYRAPVNFNVEAYKKLSETLDGIYEFYESLGEKIGKPIGKYIEAFREDLNDDFNTPRAVTHIFALKRDTDADNADKKATLLHFDAVLGLGLAEHRSHQKSEKIKIPAKIEKLAAEREAARQSKDWKKADELRMEIEKAGFKVKDTDTGTIVSI